MDNSGTYIKMRIAAIPDLGNGEPLEETFRSKQHYVFENDEYDVFISREGNWHIFHPLIPMNREQGRTCQLERQDQLQAMVPTALGSTQPNYKMISELNHFYDYWDTEGIPNYLITWEQLWLAFVMKEKYNKVWNGDSWTSG